VRRPVLTLILLASLTFLVGLGRQAITDADEAFYAEAAREMVASGDWLTPHFNYERRWEKPVLYYWLTSAAFLITGPSEASSRLGSALSGIALTLLTYFIALRGRANERGAWLAAAIVASCFGYFAEARMALPDLPLACFITLTIWAALRAAESDAMQWWIVTGLAAGFGFLTKGPVAIVLPAIVVVPIWWYERRRITIRFSGVAAAVVVAAVVGLPWYIAMWRVHGIEYLRVFFLENNVQRFATEEYNGARPLWFYVPIVLGGLLPWTAYVIVFTAGHGTRSQDDALAAPSTDWQFVVWLLMPLLFYTASIGKQPRYILPILPPLAILLAHGITRCISRRDRAASRSLAIATWTTIGIFVAAAALLARAQALFINTYATLTWVSIAGLVIAALVLAAIAIRGSWSKLPIALACASAIFLLAVQFGALAGRRPDAVEQMAALVRSNRQGNERVAEYRVFVRNLVFYLGFKQQELFDLAQAQAFLQSSDRVLLVASRQDVAALQQSSATPLRVLGEVRYANTANLRLRDVLAPDPEKNVETVSLVTNR